MPALLGMTGRLPEVSAGRQQGLEDLGTGTLSWVYGNTVSVLSVPDVQIIRHKVFVQENQGLAGTHPARVC